ncbi:MAG: class I SAM-dependent methyltransferase [Planctomycetes bacterium]|nr:class I SAM-dependent methyltransferase [Planctomycetota bacterium]
MLRETPADVHGRNIAGGALLLLGIVGLLGYAKPPISLDPKWLVTIEIIFLFLGVSILYPPARQYLTPLVDLVITLLTGRRLPLRGPEGPGIDPPALNPKSGITALPRPQVDGGLGPQAAEVPRQPLAAVGGAAVAAEGRAPVAHAAAVPLNGEFHVPDWSVPTYSLDARFNIQCWNPAFEMVFGTVPTLLEGSHVSEWCQHLRNYDKILDRARRVFGNGIPLADVEDLEFASREFGLMNFTKLSSAVTKPGTMECVRWNVALNVNKVERSKEFEERLRRTLEDQVCWTAMAPVYDELLPKFGEYVRLADLHLSAARGCQSVLELGAGTGYLTSKLLNGNRRVCAVDFNDAMLERLRDNCGNRATLTVKKQDIRYLRGFMPGKFDAVLMMNVAFSVEDTQALFDRVATLLPKGGVLAFSVPREGSDLDTLFAALQRDLEDKKLWEGRYEQFQNLRQHNERMRTGNSLRTFTAEQLRHMLGKANFETIDETVAYAGQGLFVSARKG